MAAPAASRVLVPADMTAPEQAKSFFLMIFMTSIITQLMDNIFENAMEMLNMQQHTWSYFGVNILLLSFTLGLAYTWWTGKIQKNWTVVVDAFREIPIFAAQKHRQTPTYALKPVKLSQTV